jgi:hypothetical protein
MVSVLARVVELLNARHNRHRVDTVYNDIKALFLFIESDTYAAAKITQ